MRQERDTAWMQLMHLGAEVFDRVRALCVEPLRAKGVDRAEDLPGGTLSDPTLQHERVEAKRPRIDEGA